MIVIGAIIFLFVLIVISGNRYHQRQQTKAIIRAIRGPKVTPINQGGLRDPLLWKFLAILAVIVLLIILSGNH
jgi:hypothetical protein